MALFDMNLLVRFQNEINDERDALKKQANVVMNKWKEMRSETESDNAKKNDKCHDRLALLLKQARTS